MTKTKKKQSKRATDTKQRVNAKGITFECLDEHVLEDGVHKVTTYQKVGFIKSPVEPAIRPLIMATKWTWSIELLAYYEGEKQPEKLILGIKTQSNFNELGPILDQFLEELREDHPDAVRFGWRAIITG